MLQPIAPGSSAMLQMPASENERSVTTDVKPQRSGGADVLFDVELDGATPAGIPVEPSAVLFEAPESGFGSLFGDVTQPAQSSF